MNWRYQNIVATTLPNKISISEIKRRYNAEEDNNTYNYSLISAPSFLSEEFESGTTYGTLMHETLQRIDFANYSQEAVTKIIDLLTDDARIKNSIIGKISKFANTRLFNEIASSKKIYREAAFNLNLKAEELYDVEINENIMVQGIIDLYFITQNDEIILVDYKTDNVQDEAELIKRYKIQLELYKRALEEILGKSVSKTIIYSFKLDKEIDILSCIDA